MPRTGTFSSLPRRDRAWAWFAAYAGGWECRLLPKRRDGWGGPFNGQTFRQQLFAELMGTIPFVAIVETGTYRGTTTAFFRRFSASPIHSFEIRPRHFGFARTLLRGLPELHVYCCDSRAGLRRLAATNALPEGPVFFYLDAHGSVDLPLAEELRLAFAHWPRAVAMLDDFAVPDDPSYAFDDYGADGVLSLGYLAQHGIVPPGIWFPRCDAAAESGARRGCVVLAHSPDIVERLDGVAALRRWPSGAPGERDRR